MIICNSIPTIRCIEYENWSSGTCDTSAPSEQVRYETRLVAMATSLEILKKNSDLLSKPKMLSYGVKIAKIAPGLRVAYDTNWLPWQCPLRNQKIWT